MAGKQPNQIDVQVGQRVRMRRMLLGFSQEKLGEACSLTFQQIQKYEKGVNRIGGSRLFQIAKALSVPPGYFFEEIEGLPTGAAPSEFAEGVIETLTSHEGLALIRAFSAIGDPRLRKSVIDLCRSLGNGDAA